METKTEQKGGEPDLEDEQLAIRVGDVALKPQPLPAPEQSSFTEAVVDSTGSVFREIVARL